MAPLLFSRAVLAGRPIEVFNHGRMRRDFTYIDDIVAGVLAALVVLVAVGAALFVVDALLHRAQSASFAPRTMSLLRFRIVGLSMTIGLVAAVWAVERRPW